MTFVILVCAMFFVLFGDTVARAEESFKPTLSWWAALRNDAVVTSSDATFATGGAYGAVLGDHGSLSWIVEARVYQGPGGWSVAGREIVTRYRPASFVTFTAGSQATAVYFYTPAPYRAWDLHSPMDAWVPTFYAPGVGVVLTGHGLKSNSVLFDTDNGGVAPFAVMNRTTWEPMPWLKLGGNVYRQPSGVEPVLFWAGEAEGRTGPFVTQVAHVERTDSDARADYVLLRYGQECTGLAQYLRLSEAARIVHELMGGFVCYPHSNLRVATNLTLVRGDVGLEMRLTAFGP